MPCASRASRGISGAGGQIITSTPAANCGSCNRAETAGIEVLSLSPCFDDFNEDLRRLGNEWLRVSLCQQLVPQDVMRFMTSAMAVTG